MQETRIPRSFCCLTRVCPLSLSSCCSTTYCKREDRETRSTCISSSYGTSKSKNTKGGFERQFADVGFGKLSALTHRHRGNTELRVRPAEPQVWLQRPALPMMQGGSWMTEQERNAGCSHLHGFCTHPEEREHPAAALSGRGWHATGLRHLWVKVQKDTWGFFSL